MSAIENAQVGQFELEVELATTPERAWTALTAEIDQWWLPDFRATGPKSTVSLDLRPGGALLEVSPEGTQLVWYTVQMVQPGAALYLVGHTAADWGGPSISILKLALTARGEGTLLTISDAVVGRVNADQLAVISSGWQALFGAGLKKHLADIRS